MVPRVGCSSDASQFLSVWRKQDCRPGGLNLAFVKCVLFFQCIPYCFIPGVAGRGVSAGPVFLTNQNSFKIRKPIKPLKIKVYLFCFAFQMPIGPALPPGFQNSSSDDDEATQNTVGPTMPPNRGGIGPAPPPLQSRPTVLSVGPLMPPHLRLAGAVGPSLPPHLQHSVPSDGESDSEPVQLPVRPPAGQSDSDDDFGPSLPPSLGPVVKGPTMPSRGQPLPASYNVQDISDSDDDEPMVGPMPPGYQSQEQSEEHILAEFNRREERMKLKLSGVDVDGERKLEREEWMTELPSLRANMISVRTPNQFFNEKPGPTETLEECTK